MDFGVASESNLAMTRGGAQQAGPAVLGPALFEQMGEPALVAALNARGGAMRGEVLALRADLGATHAAVSGAFVQAQEAVHDLVTTFRIEVVAMRQTTMYEAQQSLARLEQVVEEARARFGEQDARFASGLGELAQRLQAADAWAQAEPPRVAAIVHAVPAPPWLSAPPPVHRTPPPAAQPAAADSPGHLVLGPALAASPAWDPWAAGRAAQGPAPPDAWAAGQAAQAAPVPPAAPRQQVDIATPGGLGGGGGGCWRCQWWCWRWWAGRNRTNAAGGRSSQHPAAPGRE